MQLDDGQDPLFPKIRELQIAVELASLCNLETSRGASLTKIRQYVSTGPVSPQKLAKYISALQRLEVNCVA